MIDERISKSSTFDSAIMPIDNAWIDYNGHLNMAYYMVLFDVASDEVFAALGMGPNYAAARSMTTYTAEAHICYLREVHQSMPIQSRLQVIGADTKRIHTFQHLVHAEENWVAATCEMVTLHVDQSGPHVAAFPDDIQHNVTMMKTAHAHLPKPSRLGRAVSMGSKAGKV